MAISLKGNFPIEWAIVSGLETMSGLEGFVILSLDLSIKITWNYGSYLDIPPQWICNDISSLH